ncbi:MAG: hypothetical protein V4714_09040 [Bacteroidota bacterium]
MKNRELKFITRKIALKFEGDQAVTILDVEKIKTEMQESYALSNDRPIAISMTENFILVTFEVFDKRDSPRIGFK